MHDIGLPFLPFYKRPGGRWLFWCPRLGRDGRCTDYENRPALCRSYEPGTDPLCAEWDGVIRPNWGFADADKVEEKQE